MVGQAKRFSKEIAQGVKRATSVLKQLALEGLRHELDEMVPLVRQVMKQTRARIFRGNTRSEGKLLSLFEPSIEVIRKSLPPRRRKASSASAFPIAQPKALSASASRKSAGSATARNGAPDPRAASAS